MPNHFHLVVETPRANLVAGMKWFLGTYTSRFNRRHKQFGHLFSGRNKALIVDGEGNGYHIVPSRIVAERVKTEHRNWKRKRKREDGEDAGETSVRLFSDAGDEFLERWDLLGL